MCGCPVDPLQFVEKAVFAPPYCICSLGSPVFHSTDPSVCFLADTTLCQLLELCSKPWRQVLSVPRYSCLQGYVASSGSLASPCEFRIFVNIHKITWLGLHWICRSTWEELTPWYYWVSLSLNMEYLYIYWVLWFHSSEFYSFPQINRSFMPNYFSILVLM